MVTDQEIAKGVETVIRQAEPNAVTTLTLNGVVQQLEAKLGQNLSHKAAFIRDQINNNLLLLGTTAAASQQQHPQQQQHFPPPSHFALQFQHQQPQQHPQQQQHFPPPSHFALHHHASQQQSQVYPQFRAAHDLNFRQPLQPPLPRHPVQAPPAKESAPTGVKRRGGPGGLNKVCGVSPELQAIVGEPALPRTEIVKKLWAYIRKYNLQDPNNKRKIVCDDALRVVFETDSTDMFKMNKLLAKHILPIDSKDSEKAKKLKVDVESTTESTDPSKTTVTISEALAKFLGVDGREMLKSEAEQRVWDYIKANQLEDPLNSMAILCDDKLRELLGCDSISALGISEMLKRHFT